MKVEDAAARTLRSDTGRAINKDISWPTFTVEDNVLVCGADVSIEVQAVSFI